MIFQGNCIDDVMFDREIEKYKDIIKQDRTIIISNAIIKKADSVFKSSFSNTDYSWIINKNTLVSLTETHPGLLGNPFRGSFTNYASYADLKIGSSISKLLFLSYFTILNLIFLPLRLIERSLKLLLLSVRNIEVGFFKFNQILYYLN